MQARQFPVRRWAPLSYNVTAPVEKLFANISIDSMTGEMVAQSQPYQDLVVTPATIFRPSVTDEIRDFWGRIWSRLRNYVDKVWGSDPPEWNGLSLGNTEQVVPVWDTWTLGKMRPKQRQAFFAGMKGKRILWGMDGPINWVGYASYEGP